MGGESQAQYGMALRKTLLIRNFLETFNPCFFMRKNNLKLYVGIKGCNLK